MRFAIFGPTEGLEATPGTYHHPMPVELLQDHHPEYVRALKVEELLKGILSGILNDDITDE